MAATLLGSAAAGGPPARSSASPRPAGPLLSHGFACYTPPSAAQAAIPPSIPQRANAPADRESGTARERARRDRPGSASHRPPGARVRRHGPGCREGRRGEPRARPGVRGDDHAAPWGRHLALHHGAADRERRGRRADVQDPQSADREDRGRAARASPAGRSSTSCASGSARPRRCASAARPRGRHPGPSAGRPSRRARCWVTLIVDGPACTQPPLRATSLGRGLAADCRCR